VDRYLILNGPNLNLLGTRAPEIYGETTLSDIEASCRRWGSELGVEIDTAQSNHEGALIDMLHDARDTHDGIVFNPGAYTHTSYALADAVDAIGVPTVETHISNVMEREPWRRTSVVGPACIKTIYGRGVEGYRWAIRHLFHRREWPPEQIRYSDHADAVIDIRRPDGSGPHRCAILVHGGFWRHPWTRDTVEGIAIDLARRGWLTANVEYRRVGTGGGWPQSVDDVACAIEGVAAAEDVGQLVVIGHSAGAQLALMAATRTQVPFLPVSLGGVLDIETAQRDNVGDGAVDAFLDGASATDASPLGIGFTEPVLVVHGDSDDRVPVSQARSFAAANPGAVLVELSGTGHYEVLERSDPAWIRTVDAVTDLLDV
jgi:3-dehydroquinate dehydratase-2